MSQEQAHLPKLLLAERRTVPGHPGEPDPVFRLPVGLSDRIVGHAVPLKELRGLWKHAFCSCALGPPRQAVAYRTLLSIDLSAGSQIRFIGRNRHAGWRFLRNPGM